MGWRMTNFAKLSPQTRCGLFHFLVDAPHLMPGHADGRRNEPVEIQMWRCPVCNELYDDECDAADCCQFDGEDGEQPPPTGCETGCPVCGDEHIDHYNAAHCCLWKDLDHATREHIAAKVEGGTPWIEALKEFST